ncbi:hypothetical protein COS31_02830 [Candidatus Roizmanbacteria bacterium CG02_land_8_20_14_3_00_36_15]|uniref:UDP-N-acetylenolpyruvoylglucosamine reductase n=2 Tax=Candidatus Roizmaniibacteriota TaxID=1752723 RepID=A0A2M8KMA3_9BACT|nr:MAG: hypothetical protein COS51_01300 [Candidatus Roizmanbacteria bacterium CG03_land_8_20_14_0_80_36_21]PIV37783.1 MAG: hypothetical protein COS31_02830 [Candidatus Roizmanbacteria bacterium CG02_land_8_20_14_3_00_36_15]PIY70017.1 MAG: hypothetical protein COY89_03395 [Candidatus Roizmanbacteria bacterium CG_4_10_14_0_8_um_filter_36_36]PJC81631.1 MAG: hypothetical protein CO007_03640 [Candidatus Roizmanbacteria bacterium CG_4_8_14_3_um_filter_36_10]PJE61039.1 MAG: hypothetical protein COU86
MLKQARNIFFLGIKGVAMANLAVILKKIGKRVYGTDIEEEFITDKLLKDNKINWQTGFDSEILSKNIDLVVYSAAHGGLDNPQIITAKKRKIKIISQAELLGELMADFQVKIAVAGCHGKTTTSSLLAYVLNRLKAKPSYLVGVPFFTSYQPVVGFADHQGTNYEKGKYFVVEADEYGVNPPKDKTPKFFKLNSDWIICTNIDFDHPDVYKNIEGTKRAFLKFFDEKKLILCIDNKTILQSLNQLKRSNYITYGFSTKADYQITNWKVNDDGSEFEIFGPRRARLDSSLFKISLFGEQNISNAAAVIVQLIEIGYKTADIKKAIVGFIGAKRRLEKVYEKNGTYLFDDYAHHPTEIKASIKALRARFTDKRIIIIFQPHTYSRTMFLLKEFADSLSLADTAFILPIFSSAREKTTQFKISSQDIINGRKNLSYVKSNVQLINQLNKVLRKGDVIVTMGAGNVYKLKEKIIKIIIQNPKFKSQNYNSKIKIEKNKNLTHYLTLRTKVIAECFIEAKTREDLINAKRYSLENNLPLFILGGGSNFAITKEKLTGLVVKNSYQDLTILNENSKNVTISVSSGCPVSLLISKCLANGWQGFEYHRGLPGSVGGAIYMNSKWTKPLSYFSDTLLYAYLIDDRGQDKKVEKNYFQFAYDYSILQKTKEILLEAVFKLKKVDGQVLKKKSEEVLEYRRLTQPQGLATSGCFFKNFKGKSVGYLIDKAGLKGLTIGDFYVSPVHANFIVNRGHGKNDDLLKLVKIIKERVKKKFGIELEEEVIVI